MTMLSDIVEVDGSLKPSVQLPDNFYDEAMNEKFMRSFIPTSDTIKLLKEVLKSFQVGATNRAWQVTGTFGTGKSDLMLLLGNYVTRRADDPVMSKFLERVRAIDPEFADDLYNARLNDWPFLLVLLSAENASSFPAFAINGLQKALEAKGLGDLLNPTLYKAALHQLSIWEGHGSKTNIEALKTALEANAGYTIDRLKAELGHEASGDAALHVFREAIHDAFGLIWFPPDAIERPRDAYTSVAKALAKKGYSGIFVIADEFSSFLSKRAKAPDAADSAAIDNLASAAFESGGNQIHFYVVSLETFASAHGDTTGSQKEIEKSGGRFRQLPLRSHDAEELIKASIRKRHGTDFFANSHKQEEDLVSLAHDLWKQRPQHDDQMQWLRHTVVRGCYPLHPLATYCLPRLNNILAQNERTMFLFIWDSERGLNHFIYNTRYETDSHRWVPTLTFADLFAYFESTLPDKKGDLLAIYQQAGSRLSAAQLAGLEGQLVRAMILLDVAAGDPALRPTPELLRHAVGLPGSEQGRVMQALTTLAENEIAYTLSDTSGYYILMKPGQSNPYTLRRVIEIAAQSLSTSPIPALNADEEQKPQLVKARRYNEERGTDRTLTSSFISSEGLSSPSTVAQALAGTDAALCYVVAESEKEVLEARSRAIQFTQQNSRLAVAVPREPSNLSHAFRLYQALQNVAAMQEYKGQENATLLGPKGTVGRYYTEQLRAARGVFDTPSQLEWYWMGERQIVKSLEDTQELATRIMLHIFPKTPKHGAQLHLSSSSAKLQKHVVDVADDILRAPFTLSGGAPKTQAIEKGAYQLGLLTQHGDILRGKAKSFDARMPTDKERYSLEVWEIIVKELKDKVSWGKIYGKLVSVPYGVYPPVLALFLATFLRLNRDFVEVHKKDGGNEQLVEIARGSVVELIEKPQNYDIVYQPLNTNQLRFLQAFQSRIVPKLGVAATLNPASLRNKMAGTLVSWLRDLPFLAKTATADDLEKILPASPEVHSAIGALLLTGMKGSTAEVAAALLDELPHLLGLSGDSTLWTETEIDEAMAHLESAVKELRGFSAQYQAYVGRSLAGVFGVPNETPHISEEVFSEARAWRVSVGAVRQESIHGDDAERYARDLLQNIDDAVDYKQLFLYALPTAFGLSHVEAWKSWHTLDAYIQRLATARVAVDERAAALQPFRRNVAQHLIQVFGGVTEGTSSILEMEGQALHALRDWRASVLPLDSADFAPHDGDTCESDAHSLLTVLDRAGIDYQRGVLRDLPRTMGLGDIDEWRDASIPDVFVQRLAEAKSHVETRLSGRHKLAVSLAGVFDLSEMEHETTASLERRVFGAAAQWQQSLHVTLPTTTNGGSDNTGDSNLSNGAVSALLNGLRTPTGNYRQLFLHALPAALDLETSPDVAPETLRDQYVEAVAATRAEITRLAAEQVERLRANGNRGTAPVTVAPTPAVVTMNAQTIRLIDAAGTGISLASADQDTLFRTVATIFDSIPEQQRRQVLAYLVKRYQQT